MKLRGLLFLLPPLAIACAPASEPVGTVQESMTVCAAGATLKGLDVSHYDGDIDWNAVASAGNAFAFAKATEGTSFTDPKFADNWAAMKASGITRGAYHFFHSNDDPIAQADFFLGVMGPLEDGDLPPSLDLEVTDGEDAATITSKATQWLDYVAQKIGRKPILYTSRRVFIEYLGNAMGLDQHSVLWDAQYQVMCPDLPDTFSNWAFWQTRDMGTIPGITVPSSVDVDVFNGSAADLLALGHAASSSGAGGAGGAKGTSASGAGSGAGGSANGGAGSKATSTGVTGGSNSGGGAPAVSAVDAETPGSEGSCAFASNAVETPRWLLVAALVTWALADRRKRARRRSSDASRSTRGTP